MAKVYALVSDLFFGERLENGLRALGHEGVVAEASDGKPGALPPDASLAVIDLGAGEPALSAIRSATAAGVPVLAFGPHVDLDLRQQALDAGATKVVAKSKLTSDFPNLVAELVK